MTRSVWNNGGRGVTIRWAVINTSLGAALIAATENGLCRLSFNEGCEALELRFPMANLIEGGDESFAALLADAVACVEEPGHMRDVPLCIKGTAFQESVWRELRRIPPGETRSYADIAVAIGKPNAVRAVGSANAANAIAVIIPCHRVIRSNGEMGGYAYGLDIKAKLLAREKGTN